jgi:hypothetical protein
MGQVLPAGQATIARLTEPSARSGFQSLWYRTGVVTPPTYLRYEIEAEVDGQIVIYSDDPAVGFPAEEGRAPIIFLIQGLRLPQAESPENLPPDPDRMRPWRRHAGRNFGPIGESLDEDGVSDFRWQLLRDWDMGWQGIKLRSLRIVLQNG